MKELIKPLPTERSRDEGRRALELLVEAPIQQLVELVAQLEEERPAAEVYDALTKPLDLAPLLRVLMSRVIYRKHPYEHQEASI